MEKFCRRTESMIAFAVSEPYLTAIPRAMIVKASPNSYITFTLTNFGESAIIHGLQLICGTILVSLFFNEHSLGTFFLYLIERPLIINSGMFHCIFNCIIIYCMSLEISKNVIGDSLLISVKKYWLFIHCFPF